MVYNNIMTPEELKTWRKSHDFNQGQLAEMLGVQLFTVSRWETGSRKIPSFLYLALEAIEKRGGEIGTQQHMETKRRK